MRTDVQDLAGPEQSLALKLFSLSAEGTQTPSSHVRREDAWRMKTPGRQDHFLPLQARALELPLQGG